MDIQINVDAGDSERMLRKAAHIMTDLRGFWPLVVPIFIGWMRRQFDTEGAYASHGWARLSPEYAAWKALTYPGKGILQATGQLRQAASRPRRTVTPQRLVLTIDDSGPRHQSVVGFHQEGTDRMPKRPLVFGDEDMPADARDELERAAVLYVDRALKAL